MRYSGVQAVLWERQTMSKRLITTCQVCRDTKAPVVEIDGSPAVGRHPNAKTGAPECDGIDSPVAEDEIIELPDSDDQPVEPSARPAAG